MTLGTYRDNPLHRLVQLIREAFDGHDGSRDGHPKATSSSDGFMSSEDKDKLDDHPTLPYWVADGYNLYPRTATKVGFGKVTSPKVPVHAAAKALAGITWTPDADTVAGLFEASTWSYVVVIGGNDKPVGYLFGDKDSFNQGALLYDNDLEEMYLRVDQTEVFRWYADGGISTGYTEDSMGDGTLNVSGGYYVNDVRVDLNASVPASASASGDAGEMRYSSTHVYICVATDTWKRAALSTW